jgi:hypothetical protein
VDQSNASRNIDNALYMMRPQPTTFIQPLLGQLAPSFGCASGGRGDAVWLGLGTLMTLYIVGCAWAAVGLLGHVAKTSLSMGGVVAKVVIETYSAGQVVVMVVDEEGADTGE